MRGWVVCFTCNRELPAHRFVAPELCCNCGYYFWLVETYGEGGRICSKLTGIRRATRRGCAGRSRSAGATDAVLSAARLSIAGRRGV